MKGGALDARSRLTPLLGTAMAGVAAGCLLLFAVFARQAILNTNPGLAVLPDAPSTAIRQAITLLTPFQTARPEPPAEEIAPAAPAVAPPPATTSPGTDVVAPTDDFTRPPADERDDADRGVIGDLPLGERLPAGVGRSDSGERGGRGHADHGNNKSQAKPSRTDHPGRGRGATGSPPRSETSGSPSAGHGRGGGKPHPQPERKPAAHGKQHGHGADHGHGRGKGNGGPSKGRGRH